MKYQTLLVAKEEGAGIITLNRPERLNAMSVALTVELDQAVTELDDDEDVKAIIVTGSGDRAFSAGADIHEMSAQSKAELDARMARRAEQGWHLATCKKPTIGAINGLAYGGGALMASTFDIRIGCERSKFRFLAAAYGRVNSTWTLPLIVGLPMARELLFTGRVVEAEEALRIGLLNRLVPSAQLMETAVEMARMIAGNHAPVVQAIKQMLIQDIGMSWREMLLHEDRTVSQTLAAPPPRESFKDFLERKTQ